MKLNVYSVTFFTQHVSVDKRTERRTIGPRTPQQTVQLLAPADDQVRKALLEMNPIGKGEELEIVGINNGPRDVFLPIGLIDDAMEEAADEVVKASKPADDDK